MKTSEDTSKSRAASEEMRHRIRLMDQEIGHRVRIARQTLRVSQKNLGDALGCTFQQIQKYEKGDNHISAPKLKLIAETLKVSPMDLLGETEKGKLMSELKDGDMLNLKGLHPHQQKLVREMVSLLKKQTEK